MFNEEHANKTNMMQMQWPGMVYFNVVVVVLWGSGV